MRLIPRSWLHLSDTMEILDLMPDHSSSSPQHQPHRSVSVPFALICADSALCSQISLEDQTSSIHLTTEIKDPFRKALKIVLVVVTRDEVYSCFTVVAGQ